LNENSGRPPPLKAQIRRLHTGVPGLDAVLGGGLPEFSFNLLAGPPGCGKTTLAHQIMFALATTAQPALYFTVLGEPPLKMLRYQQQFDFFDLDKLNRSIRFINLAEDLAGGNLEQVLTRIATEVETHQPGLVVVDSFRSVVEASQDEGHSYLNQQRFIQSLGVLMTSWQATTFLIGEYVSDTERNPIFTVADGLIWLRQSTQGNSVVRKMEIMKMRGQPTLPGLHTFRIDHAGVRVFAPPPQAPLLEGPPAAGEPVAHRLSLGVPRLDEMMGGGLPRGYSLLVAGPSGSGKSILASLIESGQVGVVDTRSSALSVDEMAMLLIEEVHRKAATRVVIDSLSGFELALAPTFRGDFRESLSRLVSALACTGVTVLMTSELEDRYQDLRFSPYGTAFLTDAIIVQRYVEVDSRLLRALAVVKVRASAHADALQRYTIDDEGLHLGEMLADHEGLLSGKPTRRSAPAAAVR